MANRKNILILGAERGLGLGLASQFFNRGWNVVGTSRHPSDDVEALQRIAETDPSRLDLAFIDVADAKAIPSFIHALAQRRFEVIFSNAGIYGPLHQSVLELTQQEALDSFMTNTIGPIRLARHLLGHLAPKGTLCFMSSHRASIAQNIEGGLEIYRATKGAQNMLSRGIYADIKMKGNTVLAIHPGWAATDMGTLHGTVAAEIDIETSVRGVADVVERHMGCGDNLYLDYLGQPLAW